jgi:uncharacterized repeat protein (TIGR03803 family)
MSANLVDAGGEAWHSCFPKEIDMSELRRPFFSSIGVQSRFMVFAGAVLLTIAVCALAPSAQAQSLSLLHLFSGPDGMEPQGNLTMDRGGNLYGTTSFGGSGHGTVFKLSRAGTGWILSTLYTFTGRADGGEPTGAVVFGPDGSLYGTTSGGGASSAGTVFNLRPPVSICHAVSCPWNETVLHSFTGSDGRAPYWSTLIFDSTGTIYGTAASGGLSCGCGVVFKLTKNSNGWNETVLYFFTGGSDGETPYGSLAIDSAGNLYGTTYQAGAFDAGTLYELSNTGAAWTETTLEAFSGSGAQGGNPNNGPAIDLQGNLYGTTSGGGSGNAGTVYQMQRTGNGWTFNVLHSFSGLGKPFDTPVLDAAGNLYATTSQGGSGTGNVFKLTRGSNGWSYSDLLDFNEDFSNGYAPVGGVVLDSSGNIYGATSLGGNQTQGCPDGGCGLIYEIVP